MTWLLLKLRSPPLEKPLGRTIERTSMTRLLLKLRSSPLEKPLSRTIERTSITWRLLKLHSSPLEKPQSRTIERNARHWQATNHLAGHLGCVFRFHSVEVQSIRPRFKSLHRSTSISRFQVIYSTQSRLKGYASNFRAPGSKDAPSN